MAAIDIKRVLAISTLAVIATVLSGCYTYEVKMSYKCVTPPVAPNTMCMEWEQIGGVKTPTQCFPGEATVTTRGGQKTMADLKIGDEILGINYDTGKPTFSPVRAWIHRDVNAVTPMSAVSFESGTLVASPRHSLATVGSEGLTYEFASELQRGSTLMASDGAKMVVNNVAETTASGLYAPLTASSNYFVSGPNMKTNVLAHNFAELRHPRRYDGIVQRLISVVEVFAPHINSIFKDEDYIHPVFVVLMKLFPWVVESPPAKQVVV